MKMNCYTLVAHVLEKGDNTFLVGDKKEQLLITFAPEFFASFSKNCPVNSLIGVKGHMKYDKETNETILLADRVVIYSKENQK